MIYKYHYRNLGVDAPLKNKAGAPKVDEVTFISTGCTFYGFKPPPSRTKNLQMSFVSNILSLRSYIAKNSKY